MINIMRRVKPDPEKSSLPQGEEVRVDFTYDAENDDLAITATPESESHFEVTWTRERNARTPVLSKRGSELKGAGWITIRRKKGAAQACRVLFRVGDSKNYDVLFVLSN